jgi:hypothetical protein
MAVELPRVKRLGPSEPTSVGRMEARVPDLGKGMDIQSKAADNLAEAATDYVTKESEYQLRTEALNRDNEFKIQSNMILERVKDYQGDPTEAYANAEKEIDELKKKLVNETTSNSIFNSSASLKDAVEAKLNDTYGDIRLKAGINYGNQRVKYEQKIDSAAIEMSKNDIVANVGLIDPNDPNTFGPLDKSISRIQDTIFKRAEQYGAVKRDAEGNILPESLDANTLISYKKPVSEAIDDAIKTAINSKRPDVADALMKKYSAFIDQSKLANLKDNLEKANTEREAYMVVSDPSYLNTIKDPIKREMIRDEADKISVARQRNIDFKRERRDKNLQNQALNLIMQRKAEGRPFLSDVDLKEDPQMSALLGNIQDAKSKQIVMDSIRKPPKYSSSQSLGRVQDMILDPDNPLKGMSREEFEPYVMDLNQRDQNRYRKMFEKANSETGEEEARKRKSVATKFKDQALAFNLLYEDDFNRVSGPEFDKRVMLTNDLLDYVETLGPNPRDEQLDKVVIDYVKQIKEKGAFTPKEPVRIKTGGREPDPELQKLDLEKRKKYVQMYFQEYKRPPNVNSKEFEAYMRDRKLPK